MMNNKIVVHRIKNLIARNEVNSTNLAQQIYNDRKEIGLYKLSDIEIDVEKVKEIIIKEKISDVFYAKYLANVIAKANPIRVKK